MGGLKMAELKPCPFCGGEAFVYYSGSPSNGSFTEVICRECKCQTLRLRGDKAIEAWNRRAEDEKVQA
jgi:Lar family restriction alleviation protein